MPVATRSPMGKSVGVYAVFAASGASALIYQVLWARRLSLVFGSTTTSVSIVLGCFMTGLALGSWGAGRLMNRIARPMRAYALMELGIGAFALAFPLLFRLADGVFTLIVGTESPAAWDLLVKALLSFSLLTIPTTLMGATLPLLTEYFRRSPRHTGNWRVGILYAVNTFGAALGILAASFLLIEWIGVFATTLFAAALNFLVACAGYAYSRGDGASPAPEAETRGGEVLDGAGKLAVGVLAAGGAVALASEVLWTRTLETLVGTSTYAFATIVLLYLVGIAAGSWLMSLCVNRVRNHPLWLGWLQLGMGIWMLAAVELFQRIAGGIAVDKSLMIPLSLVFRNDVLAMSVLMPLALLSGACFPLATRMIDPDSEDARGGRIARAYGWNTVGAVAGSLVAGFVIAPSFEFFDSLYVLSVSYGVISLVVLLTIAGSKGRISGGKRAVLPAAALSLAVVSLASYLATGESRYTRQFVAKHSRTAVVFHKPGLQGVTTVIRRGSPFQAAGGPSRYDVLLVNGMGMTAKVTDTKMMAHLPLLVHPRPKDTLVICFGMGTTYRSAVSHGGNVTSVELVKEVYEAFDYFYDDAARVRAYPGGRMVVNDGRNFLKLTSRKFDVITIDPPPPIDGAGVCHLYSREFIGLAKAHLNPGGIMAHWIPFPGTQSGVDDEETFKMLLMTFAEAFPYVYVIEGYANVGMHVLGTDAPLPDVGGRIAERLVGSAVARDIREWDDVPSSYFEKLRPLRVEPTEHLTLTDDRPFLEFYLLRTLRNGGRKMFPTSAW